MRIFATSDLHADFAANGEWLAGLSRADFADDVLVVAGDIAHRLQTVEIALSGLVERFAAVFFVPGNHELWVRGESGDSLEKFERVLALCRALGVHTEMRACGEWWIAPLFSWYSPDLDSADCGDDAALSAWGDFRYCRWPAGVGALDRIFADRNGECAAPASGRVLTFSHFLPRIDLLPDPAHLRFKGLPRVAGSPLIESQLRALGSELHLFGHSHIRWDETIDGVRYLQRPLGYPQERRGRAYELARLV